METLQRTANRGSISTGYDIDNSLKLEPDNTEYLYKTQSNGNKKTWTCSFWFKRTELNDADFPAFISATSSSWATRISIFNNGAFWVDLGYGTSYYRNIANALIRDTSAWYHFVVAVDSTQATASDRLKAYINGNLITSWNTQNLPAQNTEFKFFDSAHDMYIGNYNNAVSFLPAGYMADMHLVEGQQLAPTSFGEFDDDSGIWKPKAYTGSYGTNGFYLDFESSGSLGADGSGNGHTWTLNNITSADQATDTPTNNFCTWNPLWAYPNTATVGNGGTSSIGGAAAVWRGSKGTIGLTNGKWYWEQKANGNDTIAGWQTENVVSVTGTNAHNVNDTIAYYESGGYIWLRDETSGRIDTTVSGSYVNGQIVGFALDLDSSPQTATFYRNGSAIASNVNIDGLTGKTIFPFTSHYQQTSNANFGGYTNISDAHTNTDENGYGAFVYAPPSGYYAICTKNLAEYG